MRNLPKHISEEISDRDDESNVFDAGPRWCGDGGDRYWLGTGPDDFAGVISDDGKKWTIRIDKRFPPLGYDGIEINDAEYGIRLVNEWWSLCLRILVNTYDIKKFPEIDEDEMIENFSMKLIRDRSRERERQREERRNWRRENPIAQVIEKGKATVRIAGLDYKDDGHDKRMQAAGQIMQGVIGKAPGNGGNSDAA